MTEEQQRGRTIIFVSLGVVIVISLGFMVWDLVVNGPAPLSVHLPRLGVVLAMFVWFLRGSIMAKWIVVAFLGIGGGTAMSGMFADTSAGIALGLSGFLYTALAAVLAVSPSVTSYLAYAQAKP